MQVLAQWWAEQIPFQPLSPYLTHRLYISNNTSAYISLPHYFYSLSLTTPGLSPKANNKRTKASMAMPYLHWCNPGNPKTAWGQLIQSAEPLTGCTPGYVLPSPVLLLPGSSLSYSRGIPRKHPPTLRLTHLLARHPGRKANYPSSASGKPDAETSCCPVNSSSLYISTLVEEESPKSRLLLLWGLPVRHRVKWMWAAHIMLNLCFSNVSVPLSCRILGLT